MTRIRVPDLPGPTKQLCWKQKITAPDAMRRCDRVADHDGLHSWELPVWQPIATAPKDGTEFIAFGHGCRDKIIYDPAIDWKPMTWICYWIAYDLERDVHVGDGMFRKETYRHDLGWKGGAHSRPTLWMPLPAAPPAPGDAKL